MMGQNVETTTKAIVFKEPHTCLPILFRVNLFEMQYVIIQTINILCVI